MDDRDLVDAPPDADAPSEPLVDAPPDADAPSEPYLSIKIWNPWMFLGAILVAVAIVGAIMLIVRSIDSPRELPPYAGQMRVATGDARLVRPETTHSSPCDHFKLVILVDHNAPPMHGTYILHMQAGMMCELSPQVVRVE